MDIRTSLDTPEVVVTLTRREALTIIDLTLSARLDRKDARRSVHTAEDRIASAFRRQVLGDDE